MRMSLYRNMVIKNQKNAVDISSPIRDTPILKEKLDGAFRTSERRRSRTSTMQFEHVGDFP